MKCLLLIAALASPALADSEVRLYNPGATVLVKLDDPQLARTVGAGKQTGPVRCYTEADNLTASAGAGDLQIVGCFVAIDRAGKLHAPAQKKWSLDHLLGVDGALRVESNDKAGVATVTVSGPAAAALGLFIGCSDRRGDVACAVDQGMAGKFTWDISFKVTKAGALAR